jgi:hypothetical protein
VIQHSHKFVLDDVDHADVADTAAAAVAAAGTDNFGVFDSGDDGNYAYNTATDVWSADDCVAVVVVVAAAAVTDDVVESVFAVLANVGNHGVLDSCSVYAAQGNRSG